MFAAYSRNEMPKLMNPVLSIVIPSHNDNVELDATISSIVLNTPEDVFEIVVVDDASNPAPVVLGRWHCVKIIRNQHRIGCGPSRYVGACAARGEWLLLIDSHSRFTPGWFEAWLSQSGMSPHDLYCGSCLGIDDNNMDVTKAKPYFGATWNFYGPDRNKAVRQPQVFECVWYPETADGFNYEIPAPMGACYFIHRANFLRLGALKNLKSWGGDEQELSLKVWLSGGSVRLIKQVRIAHKFKLGKLNKIAPSDPIRNKLFVMHTCLPPHLALRLQKKMHRGGDLMTALRRLHDERHVVETERAYNATIFTRDFSWYLQRFGLSFPVD